MDSKRTFQVIQIQETETEELFHDCNDDQEILVQAPAGHEQLQQWRDSCARFKVVKIVSQEPFKRGRWSCLEFEDPPPVSTTTAALSTASSGAASSITIESDSRDSTVSSTSQENKESTVDLAESDQAPCTTVQVPPTQVTPPVVEKPAEKSEKPAETEEADSSGSQLNYAIDNKIEQAMDLVKSHLMFAVREEVDVLKEKITELVDRIGQLELENSILKAHATPEALQSLQEALISSEDGLPTVPASATCVESSNLNLDSMDTS